MGLIILSLMIMMVALMVVIQKRALPIVRAVQQQLDKLTDLVRDHIIGMSVIRAFNRSRDEKAAEIRMFSDLSSKETQLARTYAIGLPSILIIFNMSTVVILWLGGYQIDSGELQIGDIMAIIEYATLILMNLIMPSSSSSTYRKPSSAMVEFKNYCCTLKIKSPRKILCASIPPKSS